MNAVSCVLISVSLQTLRRVIKSISPSLPINSTIFCIPLLSSTMLFLQFMNTSSFLKCHYDRIFEVRCYYIFTKSIWLLPHIPNHFLIRALEVRERPHLHLLHIHDNCRPRWGMHSLLYYRHSKVAEVFLTYQHIPTPNGQTVCMPQNAEICIDKLKHPSV